MITFDQLVPPNHLVRKMEASIDFTFIYDLVKDMYSEVGRRSNDPVILVKLTFIQYTFAIRSIRQLCVYSGMQKKSKVCVGLL
ncbi:hypothetical protein COF64_06050 [Bacillus sp. AFS043905]|nr:hypothetical protein COF64_06050 [Bacillus sp. AFS043905]